MNKLARAFKAEAERLYELSKALEFKDPERAETCLKLAFEAAGAADACTIRHLRRKADRVSGNEKG